MTDNMVGVTLTTSEIRNITSNIKTISSDIEETTKSFYGTMQTLTGQAEGGLIEQTSTAATQLYEGLKTVGNCFLDLGIRIGDFLKMMLTHDSDMAGEMRERIQSRG